MTALKRFPRSVCILSLLVCASGFAAWPLAAQEHDELAERALAIARDDPRVKDVLADFPETRMVPAYLERFDVWTIELLLGDRREVGLVSVSLERGEVVEFNFNVDEVRDADDEEVEREGPFSAGTFFRRFRPHLEGPALAWVSFVLVLLFVGNFTRILSLRNLDIVLLYLLTPFINVIWQNRAVAYGGIFVVTVLLFARCIAATRVNHTPPARSNLTTTRAACFVLALACLFHVQTAYERGIDDSGIWSVAGAKYLQETGHLPYGTAFGWNCVYGPLMYPLHIPGNLLFPPNVSFEPDGGEASIGFYEGFEMRGAKTTVLVFDFLAMLALYLFGRRYADHATGVLLALIYALNPHVIGLGGAGGLQWVSHIAGIAFVVFAITFVAQPLVAGLLLGIACGMLYYPIFLFPLWIGYYLRTSGRKDAARFLVAVAVVGFVCLIMILALTVPTAERAHVSRLRLFLDDTVLQQQFKEGYGTSEYSFWGQYRSIASWGKPLVGVLYLLFCASLGFLPRQINMKRLIALTAAVLVGTQLVLSHGGGTYIGFYIAPLIITLFGPQHYREMPTRVRV